MERGWSWALLGFGLCVAAWRPGPPSHARVPGGPWASVMALPGGRDPPAEGCDQSSAED